MSTDYRATVFLPKTEFPMRAGLPKREPDLLARWQRIDLFRQLREQSRDREKFILHDGPPYANGHLHIGHALNKILKDVVNRSQQMLGKNAHYLPGWDCHGLPVEWKVEETYRARGIAKDDVPILEFRRQCREFAGEWIGVQREEFERLGVLGDWDSYYTTMSFEAEAVIAQEIARFAMSGALYRGAKPVLWSVVEQTALAEAEVEYHDHVSASIYVPFRVERPGERSGLAPGQTVVIWTTTPWTLPSNRAIAVAEDGDYRLVRVTGVADDSRVSVGTELVVAVELLDTMFAACGIIDHEVLAGISGADLVGTVCRHPLEGRGYDNDVPVLAADFVTMEQGTGFVHIAPGHGQDDYELGAAHGLEVTDNVAPDGSFRPHVPLFAGRCILDEDGREGDANEAVMAALDEAEGLYGRGRLSHSYPHSWRSKAPLIFRNTSQWFISMETNDLRRKALESIEATRFVPEAGRNRLYGMIEQRPDWCISRQRAWGVPIPVFVHVDSGEILRDPEVFERVVEAFRAEGGDAWFASPPERFLGPDHDPAEYEQVQDIVDVWFDSGATHAFVLESNPDLAWPASLYLEGSDQHRGWFHSSLLESCGTRGRAPYDAVLTHGFVLDEHGRKMSKSLGNATAPQDVIAQYGADILRIWVVSSDYSEDLRIGHEILKHQADLYRRVRNTLRYLLGSLSDFDPRERVVHSDMPELERLILHRLWELDRDVRQCTDEYEYHTLWTRLHNFCAVDLSAFYFDIRKDSLYCDAPDSLRRRACRTVLDILFDTLTTWLAPILCFTAEEAWLHRHGDGASVHLEQFREIPAIWRNDRLAERWDRVRALRRVVTGALERERAEKRLGSSLQAHPKVYASSDHIDALQGLDLPEIAIVSGVDLIEIEGEPPSEAFVLPDVPGVGVVSALSPDRRCERCWQHLPDVGLDAEHSDLCGRCCGVVASLAAA